MKAILFLFALFIFSNGLQASCVNWSELYSCKDGDASLHRGQGWCSGNTKTAYHLTINSKHAQEHLAQMARTELTFLSLMPTENYGIFTSSVNQYVSAVVTENHQESTVNVELFLDSKKLGEYIFRDCGF